ncbi:MAG: acyl-CoA thioesterase, partial [Eggerthellaceae bacterium]|nr:acyl-CoA thioesterase [Eggerthellaceae bacterium]
MTIGMERDYRLRWMDFDRYGRMQPAAILDIFQDLAIAHAESLGIGRAAMLERGVVWVVIRMKLEMLGEPRPDSVVSVRTWPHSLSKFSFIRDFLMRDEDGAELVKATQEWVLMNFETRRFAPARDVYKGPDDFDEARAFERKPRKIADFEAEGAPAFVVVPA